jgi:MFS transporter, AAHS family, 4-hydroxybenzoate transporter
VARLKAVPHILQMNFIGGSLSIFKHFHYFAPKITAYFTQTKSHNIMDTKITHLIDDTKISTLQMTTIFICFLMNMLDGMDVMVVSYAAPAIGKEWAISPQAMGSVFSAGLLGMTLGTLFIAPRADIVGRRAVILLSALVMGITVFSTFLAQSVEMLIFFRFISGLGIGSMLASTATLTSEYAPVKTKDFWVSFAMSGYSIGAVLSGLAAAHIIPAYGWRAMFQTAGVVTLLTLPLIFFFLSESLDFLLKRQPQGALKKANDILGKMNRDTFMALPPLSIESIEKPSVTSLLTPERKTATLQLWFALFMAFASLYFLTTWIPKLASSTGLSMELAIYAGTVFNLGAFVGIMTQGYLSSQFGLRRTIFGFLAVTAVLMAIFGFFKGSALVLVLFGLIGFGVQGGFVGLYAVAARLYPTEIRSTGVGFAMSSGRLGGIVGPLLGGFLIGAGFSMTANFMIFAIPTFTAGIATLWLKSKDIV